MKAISTETICASLIVLAIACNFPLLGQRPGAQKAQKSGAPSAQPKYKAIWEPINYKEDIALQDVFFVDHEHGWVSGDKGTILFTKDGGDTWTPQLGGDPGAQGSVISDLFFLDGKTGWARQHYDLLLHTSNGQDWQQIGNLREYNSQFLSGTRGFHSYSSSISVTEDSGRTWKEAWPCRVKMEISGLSRDQSCGMVAIHFPTPQVGYAVGTARVTAKTEDGGRTWAALIGPEEQGDQRVNHVHFTSETSGVQIRSVNAGARFFRTDDGGKTWTGVVGLAGFGLRFANANVGWSFREDGTFSYTTDGGRRWTTRQIKFPAAVKGFSLPRPDRGYVVGEHGMIYRYRVVPADYTAKGALDAPVISTTAQ